MRRYVRRPRRGAAGGLVAERRGSDRRRRECGRACWSVTVSRLPGKRSQANRRSRFSPCTVAERGQARLHAQLWYPQGIWSFSGLEEMGLSRADFSHRRDRGIVAPRTTQDRSSAIYGYVNLRARRFLAVAEQPDLGVGGLCPQVLAGMTLYGRLWSGNDGQNSLAAHRVASRCRPLGQLVCVSRASQGHL